MGNPRDNRKGHKQYLWIKCWGAMMGSQHYYVESQQRLAMNDGADELAIFKGQDGWETLHDVQNPSMQHRIRRWATNNGTTVPAEVEASWTKYESERPEKDFVDSVKQAMSDGMSYEDMQATIERMRDEAARTGQAIIVSSSVPNN